MTTPDLRAALNDAIRLGHNTAGRVLGHPGRFENCPQPLCVRCRAALAAEPSGPVEQEPNPPDPNDDPTCSQCGHRRHNHGDEGGCYVCDAGVCPVFEPASEAGRVGLRGVVLAYLAHMDARESFDGATMKPGDGRHFDGDGCFAALEDAATEPPALDPGAGR